jgi:hypothetical protein
VHSTTCCRSRCHSLVAQVLAVPFVPAAKPVAEVVRRSNVATRSSSACVVGPPSVTAGALLLLLAVWAEPSSTPVAASPANSAARAATSVDLELLTVIGVPFCTLWALWLAQMADRLPLCHLNVGRVRTVDGIRTADGCQRIVGGDEHDDTVARGHRADGERCPGRGDLARAPARTRCSRRRAPPGLRWRARRAPPRAAAS